MATEFVTAIKTNEIPVDAVKAIDVRGLDLIELEDGEIVTLTAYYDGASFARQVGLLPPEGSGAERAMMGAFNAVTKVRQAIAARAGS